MVVTTLKTSKVASSERFAEDVHKCFDDLKMVVLTETESQTERPVKK